MAIDNQELFTVLTLFLLFALGIVFPPPEARQAGFTIPKLFYSLLGDERFDFVRHHLKRSCLTLFIHSTLPMIFTLILYFYFYEDFIYDSVNIVRSFFAFSVTCIFVMLGYLFKISRNNYSDHSIMRNLAKYDDNTDELIEQINDECRSFDTFKVEYTGYAKIIVTATWIIRVSMYNVSFLKISDAKLKLVRATDHPLLSNDITDLQLIDVIAESHSTITQPIRIRVYSRAMFNDLQGALGAQVEIVQDVHFKSSLNERFVSVFSRQVNENPCYDYDNRYELEPCLGCQTEISNVKLFKTCVETTDCRSCLCRPMWCSNCIARIFASRQDAEHPEEWLAGRAECPTCRALFCALDVCLLAGSAPIPTA